MILTGNLLGSVLIFVVPIIIAVGAVWFWFYRK